MNKFLPINETSFMRTYTHHGFFHAVTNSAEKVSHNTNDAVAKVFLKDYCLHKWDIQNGQMNYDIDQEGNINAYANKWNLGMNLAFFRPCQQNDEIEITIYKQLYSNVRNSITLFLTNTNQDDMLDLDQYDIKIGNTSKNGVYDTTENIVETYDYLCRNPVLPLKLRLIKEENRIFVEYSDNELHCGKKLVKELENDCEYGKIGFAINLGNSSYYEWVFSNYIQLYSNLDKPMPIEYMFNIHKNWHSFTSNYFVDYIIITEKDVHKNGDSTIGFIERQIDSGWYVEVLLNDNLHIKGAEERTPFFHQNLIYGYDNEKKELYLLYYNNGKPLAAIMSYQDYLSERNVDPDRVFYCMKYNPGIEKYDLSKAHLLQVFKEYRDGINISYYEPDLENGYEFGLNCMRKLCTSEGLERVLYDMRISHLLYEHAMCNKERVQYLTAKGIICEEDCSEMINMLDIEMKNFSIIRNVAIKVMVGGKGQISDVDELMQESFDWEQKFTERIIATLES